MDESLPPKPNELHSTFSSFALDSLSPSHECPCPMPAPAKGETVSGPLLLQLRLTGTKPSYIARMQITASTEPDALVVCPVKDFVDDTAGIFSGNSLLRAALSLASLLGVPVPWALT